MSEHVTTSRSVNAAGARAALEAARAEALRTGVAVNIAVVDIAGNLLAFERMDGAALLSSTIAQDKAWSVTAFNGMPTHEWYGVLQDHPELMTGLVHRERLVVFGGGVPVRVDGELVGAVGVSGGTADEDRRIAEAGAVAVL